MRYLSIISSVFAVLAMALSPVAATAQETLPEAQKPQVVTQFDDITIRYLLQDLRANWRREQGVNGRIIYRVNAEDGINFTIAPHNCTPQGICAGVMLIAIFTDINGVGTAQIDGFLNNFNDFHPTAKVMRGAQGIVTLQTYIEASHGISYRNAQTQMLTFGQNIIVMSNELAAFIDAQ